MAKTDGGLQPGRASCGPVQHQPRGAQSKINARVTTADAEQTTVAAFLPWRGS